MAQLFPITAAKLTELSGRFYIGPLVFRVIVNIETKLDATFAKRK
jgi:hypothetical protein